MDLEAAQFTSCASQLQNSAKINKSHNIRMKLQVCFPIMYSLQSHGSDFRRMQASLSPRLHSRGCMQKWHRPVCMQQRPRISIFWLLARQTIWISRSRRDQVRYFAIVWTLLGPELDKTDQKGWHGAYLCAEHRYLVLKYQIRLINMGYSAKWLPQMTLVTPTVVV